LVSCVIGLDERLWPSMTSTGIGVFFFTRANLYCYISSLSIRHADVLESRTFGPPSSQVYYFWQWLVPINMMLGLKMGYDHSHYMMNQSSASQSLLKLDMLVFQLFQLWVGNKDGVRCVLHVIHNFLDIHK
jgi:hypothetical protein